MYKRNQVEEGIASAVGATDDDSSSELRVRIKRLLEIDRSLERKSFENDSERKTCAFYSASPPGSGLEVWFSSYEAFALLMALQLQEHGWPQATAVRIMRQARPTLEPHHTRILAHDPRRLFDKDAVLRNAGPGMLAVDNTDPVFLAIVTGQRGRSGRARSAPTAVSACRGQVELLSFIREQAPAGMTTTYVEVVSHAYRLAKHLRRTKPTIRGPGRRTSVC